MLLPHLGMVELNIPGRRSALQGAGVEADVIPWSTTYVFPTVPFIPTVDALSGADSGMGGGGTGARTIRVEGLDANWLEQSEVVVMNGTQAVTLTKSYIRINRAVVLTVGSFGTNSNQIDVLNGATIVAQISSDKAGQSQQLVYSFPANWTEIRFHGLHKWTSQSSATVNLFVKHREFGQGFRRIGQILTSNDDGEGFLENPVGVELFPKGDLVVFGTTTFTGQIVAANMYITARRVPLVTP